VPLSICESVLLCLGLTLTRQLRIILLVLCLLPQFPEEAYEVLLGLARLAELSFLPWLFNYLHRICFFLGWGLGFNFNCIPFFKASDYPMRGFCVFKGRVPSRTFIAFIPSIFSIKNVDANKCVIAKTISSKSLSAFRNYGKLIFLFARLNRGEFGCRCCFLHTPTLSHPQNL